MFNYDRLMKAKYLRGIDIEDSYGYSNHIDPLIVWRILDYVLYHKIC